MTSSVEVIEAQSAPNQEFEILPKAPPGLRPKEALIRAHRLLSSYLSEGDLQTDDKVGTGESDSLDSGPSKEETERKKSKENEGSDVKPVLESESKLLSDIQTTPKSESELLNELVKQIKMTLERKEVEAKKEKRLQMTKQWEHQVMRVGWPGYVYFRQDEEIGNQGPLLVLHGRPKHYSEYAKEVLKQSDFREKTISVFDDAAPDILSEIPTERVYLIQIGDPFRKFLVDIIRDSTMGMFWPFKRLHYYDRNVRNTLHLLKTHLSEEDQSRTSDNSPVAVGSTNINIPNGDDNVNQDAKAIEKELELSESKMPGTSSETVAKIKDLELLLSFVDRDLAPIWERFSTAGEKCQTVRFEDLWFVFRPGDICFAPVTSTLRATMKSKASSVVRDAVAQTLSNSQRYQESWRVLCTTGGRPQLEPSSDSDGAEMKINPFRIRCYYIDFDGTNFFPVLHDFEIGLFEGEVSLPSLEICPSRFVVGGKDIEAEFRKTGEVFRDLKKFKSFYYSESTFIGHPCGCPTPKLDEQIPEFIESPVVVDFSEALRTNRHWLIDNHSILEALPSDDRETSQYEKFTFTAKKSSHKVDVTTGIVSWNSDEDDELDEVLMEDFISGNNFLKRFRDDINSNFEDLDENDLVLLPPRVFGFVLRSRKFALLKVKHLDPIRRNEDGFSRLKLPDGHKRMVQSLVIHHMNEMSVRATKDESHGYDIVRGKGRGLIVLLHGAPGVGKTSTAECVANASGKPLFPITCGDLGVEASQVEKELEQKFHLAQRWNCVLLLDEADVFLTQRTRGDINHNSLVSVFLRVLEYYTGILFLTTNRVGAFDMAFKSRIHISLYYPPLGHKQTLDIWKMNLEAVKERKQDTLDIKKDKILQFTKSHYISMRKKDMQWNGRQIRNAVQTAVALAEYEYFAEKKKQENQGGESAKTTFKPCELLPKHFKIVAFAAEEFDNHLMEIYGAGEDERAFNRMDRAKKGEVTNLFKNRDEYEYSTPQKNDRRGMYAVGSSPSYNLQPSRARPNTGGRGMGWYQQDDDFEDEEELEEQEEQEEEAEEEAPPPPPSRNTRGGSRGLRARGGRGTPQLSVTPEPAQRRRAASPRWNDQNDAQDEEDGLYMWNED